MRDLPVDDFLSGQSFSKGLKPDAPAPKAVSAANVPAPKTIAPGILQGADGKMSTNIPVPKMSVADVKMFDADLRPSREGTKGLRMAPPPSRPPCTTAPPSRPGRTSCLIPSRLVSGYASEHTRRGVQLLVTAFGGDSVLFDLPPLVFDEVIKMIDASAEHPPTVEQLIVACGLAQYRA